MWRALELAQESCCMFPGQAQAQHGADIVGVGSRSALGDEALLCLLAQPAACMASLMAALGPLMQGLQGQAAAFDLYR
jgi:hypothetical protein